MKKYLTLLLLILATTALAADVTLEWTPPTTNEDGSALTDLAGYKVYQGSTSGNYTITTDVPDPLQTQLNVVDLGVGSYYFVATAYNTSGAESAYTNEVVKIVAPSVPSAPGPLTVQDLVAYAISQSDNRIVLLPVGTVPAETECDPYMQVNGYHLVPRETVNWAAGARPATVYALCG